MGAAALDISQVEGLTPDGLHATQTQPTPSAQAYKNYEALLNICNVENEGKRRRIVEILETKSIDKEDLGHLRIDQIKKCILEFRDCQGRSMPTTVEIVILEMHGRARGYSSCDIVSSNPTSQGAVSKTPMKAFLDICNVEIGRKRDQLSEILEFEYIKNKEDLVVLPSHRLEEIILKFRNHKGESMATTVAIVLREIHKHARSADSSKSTEPSSKAASQGAVSKTPMKAFLDICNVESGRKRTRIEQILEAAFIENKEDLANLPPHKLDEILKGKRTVIKMAIKKLHKQARYKK